MFSFNMRVINWPPFFRSPGSITQLSSSNLSVFIYDTLQKETPSSLFFFFPPKNARGWPTIYRGLPFQSEKRAGLFPGEEC